ncbi:unnamed protein product [Closterium sp. Yama58-4]|nr:unnamed protein product [Closterium sp. Yama58-4]
MTESREGANGMMEARDVVGVETGIGAAVIAREYLATGMGAGKPSLRESLPAGMGAGTPSLRAILPPGIGAAVIPRESLATGIDVILGRENPPNGPPLLRCYARRLPPCLAQRNAAGVGDGVKEFATWSKLNHHVATHTKPFVCQHCQKGFARKDSLQAFTTPMLPR